jgi:ATP synthase F1 gamma subunit
MLHDQDITQELEQLQILMAVTGVYGQVASIWMSRARDNILRSRDYLEEMRQVFLTTFASYSREVVRLSKQKKLNRNGNITFLSHNGQKVAVFLSANTGFYGEVMAKTFELFLKDVRSENLEVTIVGRHGQVLFTNEEPNRSYTFFDFSDEKLDSQQLLDLMRHLVQYEEIRIYYGKFVNFLQQEPVVFRLSSNPYENLSEQEKSKKYIFEPNLETILMFFEKQIFTSMFEQSMRESQLAKSASRIMAMDKAGENIKRKLKSLREQELRYIHRRNNQKQLNQLSSFSLWH